MGRRDNDAWLDVLEWGEALVVLFSYLSGLALPAIAVLLSDRRHLSWPAVLLAVVLPFVVWNGLSYVVGPSGTLTNALFEPLLLGLTSGVSILAWTVLKRVRPNLSRLSQFHCAWINAAIALLLVFLFPDLPE